MVLHFAVLNISYTMFTTQRRKLMSPFHARSEGEKPSGILWNHDPNNEYALMIKQSGHDTP